MSYSYTTASYMMRADPGASVECRVQVPRPSVVRELGYMPQPFAFLEMGGLTVYASVAQLAQIRDAITACLESPEAKALAEAAAKALAEAPAHPAAEPGTLTPPTSKDGPQ